MLDISVTECGETGRVFTLKGELVGFWAGALGTMWKRGRIPDCARCVVDLAGVVRLDVASEAGIRQIAADGTHFKVSGPITSSIITLACREQRRSLLSGERQFRSIVSCLHS